MSTLWFQLPVTMAVTMAGGVLPPTSAAVLLAMGVATAVLVSINTIHIHLLWMFYSAKECLNLETDIDE